MYKLDKIYNDMKIAGINGIDKYIEKYNGDMTIETLLFVAYDIYKYNPSTLIIEERVKRQHQKKFRNQIEKRDKCCIISGDDSEMCEACHIIPFCESDNSNMYSVNNGIILSANLHKLFDKYFLSIDETGKVILSKNVIQKLLQIS